MNGKNYHLNDLVDGFLRFDAHHLHSIGHLDDHLAHKEHLEGKVEGKQGFRVPFHMPALMGQPPNKYEEEEMVH